MKVSILHMVLLLLVQGITAQQASEGQAQSLDDVVVKEKYQAGGDEQKLPVFLKTDFSNLVEIPDRIYWSTVSWQYAGEKPSPDLFGGRISSPALCRIIPEPAKVFQVSFKDLASWKIDIITSDGRNFRSISGQGEPPRSIGWDGRGDDGSPLIPGAHYAYSFTAIDRAGNRRTFPGEAFTVPAIYLFTEQGLWVGISENALFSPEGYGLSKTAADYSRELVNFIYYYSQQGDITIHSKHPETGQFLQLLAQQLGRDLSQFKPVSDASAEGNYFMMWIN